MVALAALSLERGAAKMATDWVDRELAKARRRLDRQGRRSGSRGRRAVTEAVIGGAMALYGATTELPQSGSTPLRDEATVMSQQERGRRSSAIGGATRYQGSQSHGSGRRKK